MSLDEDTLLSLCPRCRYRLRGLPIEHTCPECGLEFDRRWVVLAGPTSPFHATRSAKSARRFMLVLAAATACLAPVFTLFRPLNAGGLFIILACLLGPSAILWCLYRNRHRFAVIGPKGLVIYQKGSMTHYELSKVGRARYRMVGKSVEVETGDGSILLSERDFFPGYMFEADACVRAINRYPRATQTADA